MPVAVAAAVLALTLRWCLGSPDPEVCPSACGIVDRGTDSTEMLQLGASRATPAPRLCMDPLRTLVEPPTALSLCGCMGDPHVGGRVPGLQCLSWSEAPQCGKVALSRWADPNARCAAVGSRCSHTPCPAEATGFNWVIGTDRLSRCVLQYIGAYQFDGAVFRRVDSSSFNVQNEFGPQDMNPDTLAAQLANGKVWLPPHPGGSAEWVTGFTPYDTMARYRCGHQVFALGAPAFMIVAQFVGVLSHMAWYVLNQRTLLNGASCANPKCGTSGNCWSCGYGEVDILEGNYCEPNLCMTLTNGNVPGPDGACLYGDANKEIVYAPRDGESPRIAAVFDRQGVTVYVNPTWAGLTATTAAADLSVRPTRASKVIRAASGARGMWRSFADTQQLPPTNRLAPPLPSNATVCAKPGWDVMDSQRYAVPVPVRCCDGQRPVSEGNLVLCPSGEELANHSTESQHDLYKIADA